LASTAAIGAVVHPPGAVIEEGAGPVLLDDGIMADAAYRLQPA
jgi:hypothetical protein